MDQSRLEGDIAGVFKNKGNDSDRQLKLMSIQIRVLGGLLGAMEEVVEALNLIKDHLEPPDVILPVSDGSKPFKEVFKTDHSEREF